MPAFLSQKPLRVWRMDLTTTGSVGAAGSSPNQPSIFPTYGYDAITIFMQLPTDGGTISLSQRTRNGPGGVTTTFALAAAGVISQAVTVTGEMGSASFLNGASAQIPEILVTLK